ncbi:MAG: aspartate aminotransferase family protein [Promethearchaeota archaeon]
MTPDNNYNKNEDEKEVFSLDPRDVKKIKTENRQITTKIPVPESVPILKHLRETEPISMRGQPPIVWDKAIDCHVYDKWGNKWLDLSSGVLVANAGHARDEIIGAIIKQAEKRLIHNYCFPSEIRMKAIDKILEFSPPYFDKVFLLTTGSETTENALKLMRTWGRTKFNDKKNIVISFENAFHGRTLGAQMLGGIPKLKDWIKNKDPEIVQVPFPDGFYNEDTDFSSFIVALDKKGIDPNNVCGVITETYQGGGADFLPKDYVQALREWCDQHNALLVFDEVQAGFGRTGKRFGFMHYDVEPDIICVGKGISSGLPISAVIGKKEIMDIYPPGSMTSTHTGNPISCAAVIANIDIIVKENLVNNAEKVGKYMHDELAKLADKYAILGASHGKGLVAGLHIVKPNSKEPDYDTALLACKMLIERGIMMFAPVGKSTLKIAPPLCINKEQIKEAVEVIDEVLSEIENDRKND